MQGSYNGHCWR